ncbi:MAG: ABC transporter substrate-binding protein [Alphaproteobacteria bacterium]|nr:ABC transporter substrate-binding protein [Alphaproteobacteria bacterium]
MQLLKQSIFAMVFVVMGSFAVSASDETDLQAATSHVEVIANRAVSILAESDLNSLEKSQKMQALLKEVMAVEAIGRIVIGKPWRTMSAEDRDKYLILFTDYLLIKYSSLVGTYDGQEVSVTKAVPAGKKDAMVFTNIGRPGEEAVSVGWRIRTLDGEMKLLDVKIADLSMVQTERDQFQTVYKNSDLSGLFTALENLIAKMKAKQLELAEQS